MAALPEEHLDLTPCGWSGYTFDAVCTCLILGADIRQRSFHCRHPCAPHPHTFSTSSLSRHFFSVSRLRLLTPNALHFHSPRRLHRLRLVSNLRPVYVPPCTQPCPFMLHLFPSFLILILLYNSLLYVHPLS